MPKKPIKFASSGSASSQSKQDHASNLHAFKASAPYLSQPASVLEPYSAQVPDKTINENPPHTASLYSQAEQMGASRDNYTYDDIAVSALDSTYLDPSTFISSLTNELDLAMAQSGLGQDFGSITTQDPWEESQHSSLGSGDSTSSTISSDPLARIAQISGIPNYAQVVPAQKISLTTPVHKPADFAQTSPHADESLLFSQQELHANAYAQELNKLAQCTNLRKFSPQEQSTLVNEYYAIFTRALNTIVLNCNNRTMVEQGLEHIQLYAPKVFASEYRNFFNICLTVAPKALFWMLQYPFFANFFLLKPQSLSTFMSKSQKLNLSMDEHVALEVSSTLNEYRELRKRFADNSTAHINLQDNILLSLYEEQILQRSMVEPSPKLTQRQKIRLQVQNNGALPQDPAKQRLNLINHQIFALHNLKVRELRAMATSLENLAHNPNRLHKIFGNDLRSFHLNKQSLLQKMNSWTKIYPVEQQCLLVKMDQGFLLRSPQEPHKVYSSSSFKDTPLVVLSGLEVCFHPEDDIQDNSQLASISTQDKDVGGAQAKLHADAELTVSEPTLKRTAQAKAQVSRANAKRTTKSIRQSTQMLDLNAITQAGNSFKQLGSQIRQAKDELKAKLQEQTGQTYTDDMLHKAYDDMLLDDYTDVSLNVSSDFKPFSTQSQLQVSDLTQEEYMEIKPSSKHAEAESKSFKQDTPPKTLTVQEGSDPSNKRSAAYFSGVFLGTHDESSLSQLHYFNERQLQVDDSQLGFMVVTL